MLTVGYDIENLTDPQIRKRYSGPVVTDPYGRQIPKHAHGTANLHRLNSSTALITDAVMALYDRIVDRNLLVRRINVVAAHVIPEQTAKQNTDFDQLDFFSDQRLQQEAEDAAPARERRRQQAVLSIKKRFGKNAILKGMNLEEGATAMKRNSQIGGHKA